MRKYYSLLIALALFLFSGTAIAIDISPLDQIDWDVCKDHLISIKKKGVLNDIIAKPLQSTYGKAFKNGNYYILCFDSQMEIATNESITINNNLESEVLVIHNLNLKQQEGVSVSPIIAIDDSNIILHSSNIYELVKISSSDIAIIGGTVSAITVTSSTSDVVISNVDIASSAAVGIDVAGQGVTIAQPDFLGDIATPILLAEGANAGVKSIDTSKVWRKMSGDGTKMDNIVGVVSDAGGVEIFQISKDKTIYLKNCSVKLKENTNFSQSDKIPQNSQVFICDNLNMELYDYVSFTFTDFQGNTSTLSEYIKLANLSEIFTNAPPVTLPAPISPVVTDDYDGDDDDAPPENRIDAVTGGMEVGDGGGNADAPVGRGCMGSIAGSSPSSPFAFLFIIMTGLSAILVRRFL